MLSDWAFEDAPKITQRRSRSEGRKSRSIKYLRAISAKANRQEQPIPAPLTPSLPASRRWATIRQKSPQLVADRRRLDLNKPKCETSINHSNQTTSSFSDVVRTAMLLRNWMTSMEHDERESEPERAATSDQYNDTENDERAILEYDTDNDEEFQNAAGGSMMKAFLRDRFKRIIWFYVSTTSLFYYYWTCLVAAGILYNMLAMVIFIFDDVFIYFFTDWLTLNMFFDFVFIVDIFIQSRLTFMHDGSEVKNTKKLWLNYLETGRIYPDIICLLPFDVFLLIQPTVSLIRIIRMVKTYRLVDFIIITQKRTIFPHATKIAILSTACYILFHWNACVYFLFSLFEGLTEDDTNAFGFSYYKVFEPRFPTCKAFEDLDCWYEENEAAVLDLDDERPKYMQQMYQYWQNKHYTLQMGNFSREYSMTIYWSSLTITTCGQQPWPSTSPQNMLEVVNTLIGVLVFATIIGSVGNVVTQMNQSVYDFREMMDGIKFYMKYRNVHADIQDRVLSCFMYLNTHNQLYDEQEVLEVLPPRFQASIAANLHLDTLGRVQLFNGCDQRFLHEVVLLVKQQVYSPNDYLCRKNEKAKEMFIVKKGVLSVIDDDESGGIELEQLQEGSTFGELSIVHVNGNLLGDRRSVSLRSVGYSDVYILHQDDVTRLLQEYPNEREVLLNNAKAMLHSRGLLQTTELGEIATGEDDVEDETMIELLSVDEQLARLSNIVNDIDTELTHMITSFSHTTLYYKQRVTSLENTLNFNRHRIRQDCLRGYFN